MSSSNPSHSPFNNTARFSCDFCGPAEAFPHFWEQVVGSDHAPIALRADWQEQLRRCHDELGFRSVRFHGLLSDDMGTLIEHDDALLYSFHNIDKVFDFVLGIGMRPFVELGFMPRALASGDETVFRYAANVTPPKDYAQWAELIRRLIAHWVARYGYAEVRNWHFEVWNEPNLEAFWSGTQAEYFKLYKDTVAAIKGVDTALKVGGPATAKNAWITDFVEFCADQQIACDFISTHHYPTDALGKESDDTETALAESPRSLLREQTRKAKDEAGAKPLFYTEWNSSSNPRDPLHDEPYAAAFVVKTILEAKGLVEGYSFWTFTDIFAENYFPSVPFHGGFGLLNLQGIAKPIYRAFELLHRLGDELLTVEGNHATVDVWVVRSTGKLTVLVSNYERPRHPLRGEHLQIALANAPQSDAVSIERIDDEHANAKALWLTMGSPEYPDATQLERLQKASALHSQPLASRYEDNTLFLEVELPPQGVAAITVEFGTSTHSRPTP